jgi:hypothetical protein
MLPTLKERFEYLKIAGVVGKATFGYDRYLNQRFYKSSEWKSLRNQIITRDGGCELGLEDYEIRGRIFIHHMNPIVDDDIIENSDYLMNPNYLICVSQEMHNAIHYGNSDILRAKEIVERRPNDTCPWKE